jgi:small subunit ribosomal protein S5
MLRLVTKRGASCTWRNVTSSSSSSHSPSHVRLFSSKSSRGGDKPKGMRRLGGPGEGVSQAGGYDFLNARLKEVDDGFFNHGWPNEKPAWGSVERDMGRPQDLDEEQELITDAYTSKMKYQTIVNESMHTQITTAGKVYSYSTLLVGGNGNGWAGFAHGRGKSPGDALIAAKKKCLKNMMYVPRMEQRGLFEDVKGQHNGAVVHLFKRPRFAYNRASPLVGTILEAFGITDVTSRMIGRNNTYSVLYATFNALTQVVSYRQMSLDRGQNYYLMFEANKRPPRTPTKHELEMQGERVKQLIINSGKMHVDMAIARENAIMDNENLNDLKVTTTHVLCVYVCAIFY